MNLKINKREFFFKKKFNYGNIINCHSYIFYNL